MRAFPSSAEPLRTRIPYSRDGYAVVGETDLTHPVMNDQQRMGRCRMVRSIYYVAAVDAAQARVIARLTDRTPLLMEKQIGEGHVLLFASGLDNLTNDLPVRPAFVPFVDRTARYLREVTASAAAGWSIRLFPCAPRAASRQSCVGVEIIGPDGHRALSLTEAASAQSFQLARAGFYQIRFANGRDALIGVNPDRRESDLAAHRQRSSATLG
jgi:hypothetical protein